MKKKCLHTGVGPIEIIIHGSCHGCRKKIDYVCFLYRNGRMHLAQKSELPILPKDFQEILPGLYIQKAMA